MDKLLHALSGVIAHLDFYRQDEVLPYLSDTTLH